MSDTPTEPTDPIHDGATAEIPAQWEGMTDDEKDEAVDDEATEGNEDDDTDESEEPRRFVDPDSVSE